MADGVRVPIRVIDGVRWGHLSALAENHVVCGESVNLKNEKFSFAGGHRIRFYKNVHWKIPDGIPLDISSVTPASAPRRHQH